MPISPLLTIIFRQSALSTSARSKVAAQDIAAVCAAIRQLIFSTAASVPPVCSLKLPDADCFAEVECVQRHLLAATKANAEIKAGLAVLQCVQDWVEFECEASFPGLHQLLRRQLYSRLYSTRLAEGCCWEDVQQTAAQHGWAEAEQRRLEGLVVEQLPPAALICAPGSASDLH